MINNRMQAIYVILSFFKLCTATEGAKMYGPSLYDQLITDEMRRDFQTKNFLENHNETSKYRKFGDLSIATLNVGTSNPLNETAQINKIIEMLTADHYTFLLLQESSKRMIEKLQSELNKSGETSHYEVNMPDKYFFNSNTNQHEYKAIIFDSKVVKKFREFDLSPDNDDRAESPRWGIYRFVGDEKSLIHVVNVDLFSLDEIVTNAILNNIIKNIRNTDLRDFPIFIGGTVNLLTEAFEKLVDHEGNEFLLKFDKKNPKEPGITYHEHGKISGGQPKDFIFLLNGKNQFELNYHRILLNTDRELFRHYAVNMIVSRSKKPIMSKL